MAAPPYKKARLVNGDKPLSHRWYISFYAWNGATGKLQKKKDYKINQYDTKGERLKYAAKAIKRINELLADGNYFEPKKKQLEAQAIYIDREKNYTADQAFKYILPLVKTSRRSATYNVYNSVSGIFLQFCRAAGWDQWMIRTFTKNDIISWLDYLQGTGLVGNRTRNNYLSHLSAMFTLMIDRKIMDENIAKGIKQLKVDTGGNTAYLPDEVTKLKEAITTDEPRLWLYITFLLYGFIRPGEVGRLRVKMVDLVNNRIHLPGDITKNRKPRAVSISPPFRNYILQLQLQMYRGEDFVFGKNLITGAFQIQKNYASALHTKIARELGFGEEYTLYSWKHTGVVLHYKAGIDVKTLQAQIGHQSLQETDIYLKSLHLFQNTEIQDKSPVI